MGQAFVPNQLGNTQQASPTQGGGSFLPFLRMLLQNAHQQRQQQPRTMAQQQNIFGAGRFLNPYQTQYNMPRPAAPPMAPPNAPALFQPRVDPAAAAAAMPKPAAPVYDPYGVNGQGGGVF